MQNSNRILDDLSRVMAGAAGAAQGVREEIDGHIKNMAERLLKDMDLVTREEFEVAREMAAKARTENEALAARIVELEAKLTKSQAESEG